MEPRCPTNKVSLNHKIIRHKSLKELEGTKSFSDVTHRTICKGKTSEMVDFENSMFWSEDGEKVCGMFS